MFDFENLEVYNKAKEFNHEIFGFLKYNTKIDSYIENQLKRAAISAAINIAEGSGRFSNQDKRNFYIIARSSIFEGVSLLELLLIEKQIELEMHKKFYSQAEEISKILFTLINNNE